MTAFDYALREITETRWMNVRYILMLYFWCISYHWRVCCWLVTIVRTDTAIEEKKLCRFFRDRIESPMDMSGRGASISEKIALKFTHINSSGPWFAISATKKCLLNFTLYENQKPVQWPHYEIRPTFDEKHRAKASSTCWDTPQRARLSNTKMEITCPIFWRLLLEVICCGKFFLNLSEQMLYVYFCLLPHIELGVIKLVCFTHIDFLKLPKLRHR